LERAKGRCLLCCVVSQIPLQRLVANVTCCGLGDILTCQDSLGVANKSATSWHLPRLRGNYEETCLMDFGHYSADAFTKHLQRSVTRSPQGCG